MPDTALALLFALCGLYAVGVIVLAVWRHGGQAAALRKNLAACPEMRTFTYRIIAHEPARRRSAQVIAFPRRLPFNPAPQPLRAAA